MYKINIKSNNYVIVQQEWIRKKFEETFGINNVIVALPVSEDSITEVNFLRILRLFVKHVQNWKQMELPILKLI